ncbi:MAG: hypothetical protein AAFQ02_03610 [Bacteroidota bacterium]
MSIRTSILLVFAVFASVLFYHSFAPKRDSTATSIQNLEKEKPTQPTTQKSTLEDATRPIDIVKQNQAEELQDFTTSVSDGREKPHSNTTANQLSTQTGSPYLEIGVEHNGQVPCLGTENQHDVEGALFVD